eukprot:885317-Prorocentrum_minimum.AAC.4
MLPHPRPKHNTVATRLLPSDRSKLRTLGTSRVAGGHGPRATGHSPLQLLRTHAEQRGAFEAEEVVPRAAHARRELAGRRREQRGPPAAVGVAC